MATSRLLVDPNYIKKADAPGFADAFARIVRPFFSIDVLQLLTVVRRIAGVALLCQRGLHAARRAVEEGEY